LPVFPPKSNALTTTRDDVRDAVCHGHIIHGWIIILICFLFPSFVSKKGNPLSGVIAAKKPLINLKEALTPASMQGNTGAKPAAGHPKMTLNTVRFAAKFFEPDPVW
jgi:hypothetical protein